MGIAVRSQNEVSSSEDVGETEGKGAAEVKHVVTLSRSEPWFTKRTRVGTVSSRAAMGLHVAPVQPVGWTVEHLRPEGRGTAECEILNRSNSAVICAVRAG